MIPQELVSIIIPTYNRADLIGETLDSILSQSYSNWECIVVDDGSSDNTKDVLETYQSKDSRFKYYQRPDNHLPGGNGARNYGFEVSSGDYIQWFDSDDLMEENLLQESLKVIGKHKADIAVSLRKKFSDDFSEVLYVDPFYEKKENIYVRFITKTRNISLLTFFVSRSAIEPYRFDERLSKSQEYEFLARVFQKEKNIYCNNSYLVKIRTHENTISNSFYEDKSKLVSMVMAREQIIARARSVVSKDDLNLIIEDYLNSLRQLLLNKHFFSFFKFLARSVWCVPLSLRISSKYFIYGALYSLTGNGYYKLK